MLFAYPEWWTAAEVEAYRAELAQGPGAATSAMTAVPDPEPEAG